MNPLDNKTSILREVGCGIAANTIAVTIMQPAFVFKTYFQNNLGAPPLKALPRGLFANIIGGGALQATVFYANTLTQKHIPEPRTLAQSLGINLISGAIGAQVATVVERIMILQQLEKKTVKDIVQSIIKTEGLPGLFKGNIACMSRDSLYIAGIFSCTDFVNTNLKAVIADKEKRQFAASLISGGAVGFATNALDTVKTRMQGDRTGNYHAFTQTISKLIKEEGPRSLVNGAGARVIVIAGLTSIIVKVKGVLPEIISQSRLA